MPKGYKHSQETKDKIRKSLLNHPVSEETREKFRINKNKWYLTHQHPLLGKTREDVTLRNLNNNPIKKRGALEKATQKKLGKHYSPNTEFKKGRKMTQEEINRVIASRIGKHLSFETRQKISKSLMGHEGLRGEKSGTWRGGKSFEPYTLDFNNSFRDSIIVRDNNCCVVCNKPQEELNYKLCVHHIDYNKLNSFPQNCVSLCRICHLNTNLNRDIWTKHFQQLLKQLYNYEYSEDQKIILDFTKGDTP